MKHTILTTILAIAVIAFIAIQEPLAGAAFGFCLVFVVAANYYDESKSTIAALEKSIALDKDLITLLNKERDALNQRATTFALNEAMHKAKLANLLSFKAEALNLCNEMVEALEEKDKEIANLNATITSLQGTIDLRKKRTPKKSNELAELTA